MESRLYKIETVIKFIEEGRLLALAADERVLSLLPKGNWIAGTLPYFMDIDKGVFTQDLIFVNELSNYTSNFLIKNYDEFSIDKVVSDSYENGYTLIIIPAFQKVHQEFSIKTEENQDLYNNPIVGWVSGINLDSKDVPKTFSGNTAQSYTNEIVAIHIELPSTKFAQLEIVNIFEQNLNNDEIRFYNNGFEVSNCLINGVEKNFSEYLIANNIKTQLPLIANYTGAQINVSIKEVNTENKTVSFYAPVFKSKTYKFSKEIGDYTDVFNTHTNDLSDENEFSCNCVLNYLYGDLENKKINNVKGPNTFGEIAYQLLNQTLVILKIEDL